MTHRPTVSSLIGRLSTREELMKFLKFRVRLRLKSESEVGAANRSATSFEQVRVISTCRDSSNLVADRFEAKFHYAILVADMFEAGRRPASSC